jgi:hypothetical protein
VPISNKVEYETRSCPCRNTIARLAAKKFKPQVYAATRSKAPRAEIMARQVPTICSTGCSARPSRIVAANIVPTVTSARSPSRPQSEHERLHGKAQKADHAGGRRRTVAGDDLLLDGAEAVAVPALEQANMPMACTTSALRRLMSVKA